MMIGKNVAIRIRIPEFKILISLKPNHPEFQKKEQSYEDADKDFGA